MISIFYNKWYNHPVVYDVWNITSSEFFSLHVQNQSDHSFFRILHRTQPLSKSVITFFHSHFLWKFSFELFFLDREVLNCTLFFCFKKSLFFKFLLLVEESYLSKKRKRKRKYCKCDLMWDLRLILLSFTEVFQDFWP